MMRVGVQEQDDDTRYLITVSVIIQNQAQKILLVQEKYPRVFGKYNLPGGHLADHERLLDGVIRETKEETNIEIVPLYLVGLYQYKKRHNGINFVFYAQVTDVVPQIDPQEILSYQWVTIDDLTQIIDDQFVNPQRHRQVLHDFRNGQRIELSYLKDFIVDPIYDNFPPSLPEESE